MCGFCFIQGKWYYHEGNAQGKGFFFTKYQGNFLEILATNPVLRPPLLLGIIIIIIIEYLHRINPSVINIK